jgi:arylsulfatase A-like enzyme
MGLEKNTIVAITADHGEEFLDHGHSGHDKTLYDEVLRVPLLIRYPGHVAAGRQVDGQIRLMDVGPTLLRLAGLRQPRFRPRTAARSLACLLAPAAPARPMPFLPAFGDLNGEIASLRTGNAKLILNLRTKAEEFYDLAQDPLEQHNVDSPAEPRADELRGMLDRWRAAAVKHPGEMVDLDAEEQNTLRSLGYLN